MAHYVAIRNAPDSTMEKLFQLSKDAERALTNEVEAACLLQRVWRGYQFRKSLRKKAHAAINIQRCWRGYVDRQIARYVYRQRELEIEKLFFDQMATKIQRVWRGFSSRKQDGLPKRDLAARRALLVRAAAKGEELRHTIDQFNESLMMLKADEAAHADAKKTERLTLTFHHLTSTRALPGVLSASIIASPPVSTLMNHTRIRNTSLDATGVPPAVFPIPGAAQAAAPSHHSRPSIDGIVLPTEDELNAVRPKLAREQREHARKARVAEEQLASEEQLLASRRAAKVAATRHAPYGGYPPNAAAAAHAAAHLAMRGKGGIAALNDPALASRPQSISGPGMGLGSGSSPTSGSVTGSVTRKPLALLAAGGLSTTFGGAESAAMRATRAGLSALTLGVQGLPPKGAANMLPHARGAASLGARGAAESGVDAGGHAGPDDASSAFARGQHDLGQTQAAAGGTFTRPHLAPGQSFDEYYAEQQRLFRASQQDHHRQQAAERAAQQAAAVADAFLPEDHELALPPLLGQSGSAHHALGHNAQGHGAQGSSGSVGIGGRLGRDTREGRGASREGRGASREGREGRDMPGARTNYGATNGGGVAGLNVGSFAGPGGNIVSNLSHGSLNGGPSFSGGNLSFTPVAGISPAFGSITPASNLTPRERDGSTPVVLSAAQSRNALLLSSGAGLGGSSGGGVGASGNNGSGSNRLSGRAAASILRPANTNPSTPRNAGKGFGTPPPLAGFIPTFVGQGSSASAEVHGAYLDESMEVAPSHASEAPYLGTLSGSMSNWVGSADGGAGAQSSDAAGGAPVCSVTRVKRGSIVNLVDNSDMAMGHYGLSDDSIASESGAHGDVTITSANAGADRQGRGNKKEPTIRVLSTMQLARAHAAQQSYLGESAFTKDDAEDLDVFVNTGAISTRSRMGGDADMTMQTAQAAHRGDQSLAVTKRSAARVQSIVT